MNKIIEQSLKLAGYNNHEELARVVNATPNPIAATEMLLGVFEEIHPEDFGQLWTSKNYDNMILVVDKIDSLNNTVYYTRYEHNTKTVFYATQEDYKNKVYVDERPKDWYTSGKVRVNGYHTVEETFPLNEFTLTYTRGTKVNSLYEWINEANSYDVEPKFEMAE